MHSFELSGFLSFLESQNLQLILQYPDEYNVKQTGDCHGIKGAQFLHSEVKEEFSMMKKDVAKLTRGSFKSYSAIQT